MNWRPPRPAPPLPASGDEPVVDRGLLAPPTVVRELVLVAVVGALQVLGTVLAVPFQPDAGPVGVYGYALLALAVLVLPLRHRFPVGAMAVTFVTTQLYWAQDTPRGPAMVALLVAVVHLMLIGRRRVALGFLLVSFALFPLLGYWLGHADRPRVFAVIGSAAWLLALVAIVEVVQIRRDRARQAARSTAEAMRRQVADERVRMARDLHDSVAHNMSLISIQAGVALHLLEQDHPEIAAPGDGEADDTPRQVGRSLSVIKDASKEALVELRSILGVLRQVDTEDEPPSVSADGAPTPQAGPRVPVPSLDRLGDLVDRARSVGVHVVVDSDSAQGLPTDLPRPVDLAAFRIVQESLTNVSRHSGADAAVVRIASSDGSLVLEVLDEGPGPGTRGTALSDLPGRGNGIIGMRERAAAVGGSLDAGPRPGRGFAVRATLPVPEMPW